MVCVDSTVGFAKSSSFTLSGRKFEYTDKTLTEFLNVTGVGTASVGAAVDQGETATAFQNNNSPRPAELTILNSIVSRQVHVISSR